MRDRMLWLLPFIEALVVAAAFVEVRFAPILMASLAIGILLQRPLFIPFAGRRPSMRVFSDEPDQLEADIVIFRNGVPIGEDVALIAFVDGWMIVEGSQCSFSLPSTKTRRVRPSFSERHLAGGNWGSIRMFGVFGTDGLAFAVRDRMLWKSFFRRSEMIDACDRWQYQLLVVDGQPLLPPDLPQREMEAYPRLNAYIFALEVVFFFAVLAALAQRHAPDLAIATALLCLLATMTRAAVYLPLMAFWSWRLRRTSGLAWAKPFAVASSDPDHQTRSIP